MARVCVPAVIEKLNISENLMTGECLYLVRLHDNKSDQKHNFYRLLEISRRLDNTVLRKKGKNNTFGSPDATFHKESEDIKESLKK